MREIYLDNAATTRPLAELKEVYAAYAEEAWQNPSALYACATRVQKQIDRAKETLLHAFGGQGHKCFLQAADRRARIRSSCAAQSRKKICIMCAPGRSIRA